MKKILFGLLACSMIYATGCKKSDDASSTPYKCTSCSSTPEAVAANDNSSKGIYKGTVVGSTGTIKFNISNTNDTISAVMVIDGTTVNLTATVAWSAGVSYVSDFTGTMGGSPVTIHFSVSADGSDVNVTATNIPGHPDAVLAVAKETSTGLLMCFEGSYKADDGSATGTLNVILSTSLGKWHATTKPLTGSGSANDDIGGTYSANKLTGTDPNGTIITGTLSGDQIDGNFTAGSGDKGTWTCKRTL